MLSSRFECDTEFRSLRRFLWNIMQFSCFLYIYSMFCLKICSSFTAAEFNTSGTLCVAALCPPASTSASGPVVLLHLSVSEAVTLQSGGTHHSAGLALTEGHISQETFTFNYFLFFLNPCMFCRHPQKIWNKTLLQNLPPFLITEKSIHKIYLPLQSCLNRSN